MNKVKIAYWAVYAFVTNLWFEWRNHRLETKRRAWTAHRLDGGGIVSLGRTTKKQAITTVAQFGSIRYIDIEVAVVFYSDKH